MSGGAFDYAQFHINDIADSIQSELNEQGKEKPKEELWMSKDYYEKYPEERFNYTYPEHIQKEFKKGIEVLRRAHVYAQRIDWLLSGDDGEETFMERLEEELEKLEK